MRRRKTRTLRRSALLLLLLAATAGCGGGEPSAPPRMPAQVADALAARSDALARRLDGGDRCGARADAEALQAKTIEAVNAGRIPARYQEELLATVSALVAAIKCVPPPVADESEEEDENEGRGKGKGKGKSKGYEEEDD